MASLVQITIWPDTEGFVWHARMGDCDITDGTAGDEYDAITKAAEAAKIELRKRRESKRLENLNK